MFEEPGDKGRLVLATIITIAALPFLWNARQDGGGESVAAIGVGSVASDGAVSGMTSPTALISPSYLVDPLAASDTTLPRVVTIDVASPSDGKSASGQANYIRWSGVGSDKDRPCGTTLAPYGARVVVTNNDNGYKVACTNVSSKPLAEGVVIVLDADEMLLIADLTDAPIPVTISW